MTEHNLFQRQQRFMHAKRLCVSNGTRSLSKNITLFSVQVGYDKSEKVAAPVTPAKQALTCVVLVCLFLNSHILFL